MSDKEAEAKKEEAAEDEKAEAKEKAEAREKAAEPTPRQTPAQWAFLAVVAGVTAGLDLWSKAWALRNLSLVNGHPPPLCTPPPGMQHYMYQRVPAHDTTVLTNWLHFRYAENCGGAWGLLHGASESLRKPFFMVVTLGAVLFIVHLYRGLEANQRSMRWALPLVLGGAIGNLVDRLRLGYVVDFIDMHWRDRYHWPTYNVADIAITVGIGLMLLEYILGPRAERKERPAKVAEAVSES